jgi:hypothetical protein
MSVGESIQALRQNVTRWSREVSTAEARGTLLYGIAGKAAGGFASGSKRRLPKKKLPLRIG